MSALACLGLNFRGDVTPKDIYAALSEVKSRKHVSFVDWCPTGGCYFPVQS